MSVSRLVQPSFLMDVSALKRAFAIYGAINHRQRLQIIQTIHNAGVINVTPIIQRLRLEQPVISAHLKILREAKIVNAEKKGGSVFYSINYSKINRITTLSERLVPHMTKDTELLQKADREIVLKPKKGIVTFTSMELEVIRLVCEENSEDEIAEKLQISKRAVEECHDVIIKKMKVRNSVGILFFAIKNGLFEI